MIESDEIATNPPSTIPLITNDNKTININQLICRLCGNHNGDDKPIGIYSDEGVSNQLAYKINEYLPIKVQEDDELPLQCCLNCTSTLLAWHDLFITTATTANRFQYYLNNKEQQQPVIVELGFVETLKNNTDPTILQRTVPVQLSSLNDFCQKPSSPPPPSKKAIKFNNKKKTYNQTNTLIPDLINETAATSTDQSEFKIDIEDATINKQSSPSLTSDDDDDEDTSKKIVFACPCCSVVFAFETDVVNHIKQQHPDCNNDLLPIKQQNIADETVKFNNNIDKQQQRRNTKLDQDLTNAAKIIVDGRIYYNCKECGKSLHSPYTYMWHMRIHTGERPYICDLCGKQFRVSQGLLRHLRETHQRIKKFACDLCGRMFATRRNVEEHRRIHTNERPYICDLCGKSFKQKASLFVHKRSHKNYFPFKCNYCNQGFRTKPPLLVHITRHTGEKPYKCETCGRCFRIKYELKRHRLIHSDEKPFHCTVCGLDFRQKRYLRNHMKSNHSLVNI